MAPPKSLIIISSFSFSSSSSSCLFTISALATLLLSSTAAGSSEGGGDGIFCYEDCLRRALALSPALPPSSDDGWVIPPSVICKDKGRAIMNAVKLTGKLPLGYLQALCHVLKEEWRVVGYVKDRFRGQDPNRLLDGRSCKTVAGDKSDSCSTV